MKHFLETLKLGLDECVQNTFEGVEDKSRYTEIFPNIQKSLPKLQKLVKQKTGIDADFEVTLDNYRNGSTFNVYSKPLNSIFSVIDKALFKTMQFSFGGGQIMKDDENLIWFRPRISYIHTTGGSNAGEMEKLYNIVYDIEKDEWREF